jgi:hypothetical protein
MRPSILRNNKHKLETDGKFTSEKTALKIMPNNKIAPYNDAKVLIG